MSEHVELHHLLDVDIEKSTTIQQKRFSILMCKSCPYLGLILATLSSLFFSLCSVIVKGLVEVNPMELAAFRFVGVLLPAIPIVIYKGEHPFPKGRRLMLVLRSFVGTTGLMLSFYAFRHMPLADASVVVFSVPVFVAIFARIFLKEPYLWGAIAAFSATLFGANAYVLLRALKGLHFSVIMTNFGSFALIQTIVISWAIGALCLPRCGTDRLLVVALALFALFSFGGQILLTLALQMEQAGPVAIARSADIVFAFFWQVLFFNEIPNPYSVGGAIVVTSCSINRAKEMGSFITGDIQC
ncbi:Solute carrier family 35 member G1 [Melipona quadrifasciata]|uniref:Solute carrier family 35 member G1 n=1 Tax=Melipona quadrifasciata TaxID=166423 RepID=A0A0M9A5G2_9HYME|nr:Solute carrier family 35 member G1 [Melipona quadrifasciata]